jgi:hypothetical protein
MKGHDMRKAKGQRLVAVAFCMTLWTLQLSYVSVAQEAKNDQAWKKYFPAKIGKSWSYRIREAKNSSNQQITRSVRQVENGKDGEIITIWQTPAEGDEGIQLLLSEKGLQDIPTGFYLLRFPIMAGDNWNYTVNSITQNRDVTVRFRVLSSGAPCQSGKYKFDDCVVVEQQDPDTRLDTVTYYAKKVGPVKYVYSEIVANDESRSRAQTLELRNYVSEQNRLEPKLPAPGPPRAPKVHD